MSRGTPDEQDYYRQMLEEIRQDVRQIRADVGDHSVRIAAVEGFQGVQKWLFGISITALISSVFVWVTSFLPGKKQ